jgi:hypothetical protein
VSTGLSIRTQARMARARMLEGMSFSSNELPPLSPVPPLSPPGTWGTWTIWPPCLLTFPVLGVYILGAIISDALNCFDVCVHRSMGWAAVAFSCEFMLAIVALVLLVTGVQWPARRRVIVAAAWAVCALAYGIPALVAALGLN